MLNYLVSPDLSASSEFSDSLEASALRAVPAYGMSEYYDPTEPGEAYAEDDDFGDEDDDEDDDFGDEDDFGDGDDDDLLGADDDDLGDDDLLGDEYEDDDLGGDDEDDDFGDDEDEDEDFGFLEKAIATAVSKAVGPQRMRYAKLSREVTNLIGKGKRRDPATQRKIGKLRETWSKLQTMKNGTAGLESPQEVLRESRPAAPAAPAAPASQGLRKVAAKVMPGLPPIRTVAPMGIPATNADRIVAERAAAAAPSGPGRADSRAEARSRFNLRGPEIVEQMKNYTFEKLASIANNANRGPDVRQAARDEIARRRAGRPAPAPVAAPPAPVAPSPRPGRPIRPVIVVRPRGPGRPAAPVAPADPFMVGPSQTPTFGAIPRIIAADNVFDAIGAFKAETALLGIGAFLLGAYAGPPLFQRLSR